MGDEPFVVNRITIVGGGPNPPASFPTEEGGGEGFTLLR